ncbi:hypothetical protein BSKO_08760 [Bryopsis sp. KO-2023]|nr:hypothetical protein BSKO_08760 [Bryopsis sp. KO-2023]
MDTQHSAENVWGLTLSFRDIETERKYLQDVKAARVRHEIASLPLTVLPGLILAISNWGNFSTLGLGMCLLNSLLCMGTVCLSRCNRQGYSTWRMVIIVVITFQSLSLFHFLHEPPPAPTWIGILTRILFKSPSLPAMFFSLNFAFCFRDHLILRLMHLPCLLKWSWKFCSSCHASATHYEATFQALGRTIDNVLSVFLVSSNEKNTFGCMSVVGMLSLTFGLLVPVGLRYFHDIFRRAAFLKRQIPAGSVSRVVDQSKSDSYETGAWFLVAGTEVIWIISRVVGSFIDGWK